MKSELSKYEVLNVVAFLSSITVRALAQAHTTLCPPPPLCYYPIIKPVLLKGTELMSAHVITTSGDVSRHIILTPRFTIIPQMQLLVTAAYCVAYGS